MTPTEAVAAAHGRIAADGLAAVWIDLVPVDAAMAAAAAVEARLDAGEELPLAGLTVAVKNNIDVAGLRTSAACRSFGRVAERHAPVVARLVGAGAVVIGVTNLDQFATGLVGTRSPYGICPNAHWEGLVSGGSSSGSAVAVARGHVDLALGTDTAGSGRVPAAANGILGWKPTKVRVSTVGVVPACESLDCVSFFARDPAVLARVLPVVDEVPPAATPASAPAVAGTLRLGIPDAAALDFDGDAGWAAACAAAVDQVVALTGATVRPVDLDPFVATGRLLYEGAFVRERVDAVGDFIEAHREDIDPVVYSIIHGAGAWGRDDLERDRARVAQRARELAPMWGQVDAIVAPTVPRVPTVQEVQAEPVLVNSMLGTYTNFVNLLGLCAVTFAVPGRPRADGPPASLTLIAPGGSDERLLELAAWIVERSGSAVEAAGAPSA